MTACRLREHRLGTEVVEQAVGGLEGGQRLPRELLDELQHVPARGGGGARCMVHGARRTVHGAWCTAVHGAQQCMVQGV